MTEDSDRLDAIFGKDSRGKTPSERAATSTSRFVRSQHQLSEYRRNASGRILNAEEALRIFGWEKLKELADKPATPIIRESTEPYQSIQKQLDEIGLTLEQVARKVRWPDESIRRFLQKKQVPFRDLTRIAQAIELDEELLGTARDRGADRDLGVRLRTLKSRDPQRFTPSTVLGLAESAWTIRKQYDLLQLVDKADRDIAQELGFTPSDDYGNKLSPDYQKGYELARRSRELLDIKADSPIDSLKDLIETRLGIPVIQLELHSEFAGATVASGSHRGIVINLVGDNERPLVRRMTMAHELGHLLWDPDHRLQKLVVDRYDQIDRDAVTSQSLDHVERRANAFAIEFLAPGTSIIQDFNTAGGGSSGLERVVTKFGVSKIAAARHLTNASHNLINVDDQRLPEISFDDWEGRESLAVPLFAPPEVPVSRRGRFAHYVLRAFEAKLISDDTAASLFGCAIDRLGAALQSTRNYVA